MTVYVLESVEFGDIYDFEYDDINDTYAYRSLISVHATLDAAVDKMNKIVESSDYYEHAHEPMKMRANIEAYMRIDANSEYYEVRCQIDDYNCAEYNGFIITELTVEE